MRITMAYKPCSRWLLIPLCVASAFVLYVTLHNVACGVGHALIQIGRVPGHDVLFALTCKP